MKERMVTRTIESYEVTCLYANVKAMTIGECHLSLPGSTPENKLDKEARKVFAESPIYGTGEFAYVSMKEYRKVSELYGMSESDFIRYAKQLPPR